MRRLRMMRPVAGVVTLAVAVVLSAKCVTAADMTPEQKACCASMGHDCGSMALERACCPGEAKKIDGLAPISAPEHVIPPVAAVVTLPDALIPQALPVGFFTSATLTQVKPPGIPTYLLVSAFRI